MHRLNLSMLLNLTRGYEAQAMPVGRMRPIRLLRVAGVADERLSDRSRPSGCAHRHGFRWLLRGHSDAIADGITWTDHDPFCGLETVKDLDIAS